MGHCRNCIGRWAQGGLEDMLTPLTKNIKLHAPCKATPSDWAEGVGMISDLSLVCYSQSVHGALPAPCSSSNHPSRIWTRVHRQTGSRNSDLELQRMSGFGVRPALISAILCDTTLSQYWSVRGTVCSSTPAALHTCTQQQPHCCL